MPETEEPVNPPVDHFLASLVSMCNSGTFEAPVTLLTGGVIVSGMVVSGKKYFDNFADTFSKGFNGFDAESVEVIRKSFAQHGDVYERKPAEGEPPLNTVYVHLRDAKYFSPTGEAIPTGRGAWFRGRLAAVSGFHLGQLVAS